MWRDPLEYITYGLVPTSQAVSRMSGSSNLDSFRDGWWLVAVQMLLCWVLPPWLVQYCSQHFCVVVVKLFYTCIHIFSIKIYYVMNQGWQVIEGSHDLFVSDVWVDQISLYKSHNQAVLLASFEQTVYKTDTFNKHSLFAKKWLLVSRRFPFYSNWLSVSCFSFLFRCFYWNSSWCGM